MAKVVASDGVELVCHEAGRSDGRAVFLLHGLSGNANVWGTTAGALAPRFRVLMPDLRGHGESGRTDDPADFTLERLAADTLELADGHGADRFAIVGHGLGGDVAQLVAIERPNRVEAMVLFGTQVGAPNPSGGLAATRAYLADVAESRGMNAAWDAYLETGLVGWVLEEVPSEIADTWRAEFVKTARAAFVGLTRSGAAQPTRASRLKSVPCSVLVVADDDEQAEAEAAELAAAFPRAKVEVVAGAGHSPQIAAAEEFNRVVLDFLKKAFTSARR